MIEIAIISGSGFYDFPRLAEPEEKDIGTPFGKSRVCLGRVDQRQIAFIARHGPGRTHLPNMINFRANQIALLGFGVDYANGVADVPTPIEVLRLNLINSKGVFLSILKKLIANFEEPRVTGFIYRFD